LLPRKKDRFLEEGGRCSKREKKRNERRKSGAWAEIPTTKEVTRENSSREGGGPKACYFGERGLGGKRGKTLALRKALKRPWGLGVKGKTFLPQI